MVNDLRTGRACCLFHFHELRDSDIPCDFGKYNFIKNGIFLSVRRHGASFLDDTILQSKALANWLFLKKLGLVKLER